MLRTPVSTKVKRKMVAPGLSKPLQDQNSLEECRVLSGRVRELEFERGKMDGIRLRLPYGHLFSRGTEESTPQV